MKKKHFILYPFEVCINKKKSIWTRTSYQCRVSVAKIKHSLYIYFFYILFVCLFFLQISYKNHHTVLQFLFFWLEKLFSFFKYTELFTRLVSKMCPYLLSCMVRKHDDGKINLMYIAFTKDLLNRIWPYLTIEIHI